MRVFTVSGHARFTSIMNVLHMQSFALQHTVYSISHVHVL